jgi:hypothetical protein
MMGETKPPALTFSQIFLVAAEFRHREDYLMTPPETRAAMGATVQARTLVFNKGDAVGVSLRTFTDPADTDALYQYSIEIMAIIEKPASEERLPPLDEITALGATAVFPFLREALANLTMRGRFGPLWIHPFDIRAALKNAETESATASG